MTRRISPGIRHTAISALTSLIGGALAGTAFWALRAPSPAPPWLGLTGLLGIVLGEAAVTALRDRHRPGRHGADHTERPRLSESDTPTASPGEP
jgi:XapX domain-containing protein